MPAVSSIGDLQPRRAVGAEIPPLVPLYEGARLREKAQFGGRQRVARRPSSRRAASPAMRMSFASARFFCPDNQSALGRSLARRSSVFST
jgi:hypothetical protein